MLFTSNWIYTSFLLRHRCELFSTFVWSLFAAFLPNVSLKRRTTLNPVLFLFGECEVIDSWCLTFRIASSNSAHIANRYTVKKILKMKINIKRIFWLLHRPQRKVLHLVTKIYYHFLSSGVYICNISLFIANIHENP